MKLDHKLIHVLTIVSSFGRYSLQQQAFTRNFVSEIASFQYAMQRKISLYQPEFWLLIVYKSRNETDQFGTLNDNKNYIHFALDL